MKAAEIEAYAKETFHEDLSTVENILAQDELHFEPTLIPVVENDFLVQKTSDQHWMPLNSLTKTLSSQNESFKSPGEFFARRSARLEELEDPPLPNHLFTERDGSTPYFDRSSEESMQDSFEKYMNSQDLYRVLAEESAPQRTTSYQSNVQGSSSYSKSFRQPEFEFSIPKGREKQNEETSPPPTLEMTFDTEENETFERNKSADSDLLESYRLENETDSLTLSATIVGVRKYVHVYVGDGHPESSFTLIQQVYLVNYRIALHISPKKQN